MAWGAFMPSHTFYTYSADALVIETGTGDVQLKADFSVARDRTRFEVEDNDNFADGDASADEIGDDANQTAMVFDADGMLVASGQFYVEEIRWYETPAGDTVSITVFEIDGIVVGYSSSEPLEISVEYKYTGSTEPGENVGGGNNALTKNNYQTYAQRDLVCFGPGTMISTDQGDIPVEWLEASDKVLTRDHGFQPILWLGRTRVAPGYFNQYPNEAPVCIPAGGLGPACPTHDLYVTGDHRILIRSPQAELQFFSAEVLAPAKAFADVGRATVQIPHRSYTVTHILCACHHLIVAQGAWVETMFTGPETLRRLSPEDYACVEELLGLDLLHQQTARPCLKRSEARLLLSQMPLHAAGNYIADAA